MMEAGWLGSLKEHFPAVLWQEQEAMSRHTTFRIGGKADVFVSPALDQAIDIISYCRRENIPLTILGNGSNVLVGDKGIPGVVLSFGREAGEIEVSESATDDTNSLHPQDMTDEGREIRAQAGALLSQVANAAAEHNLTGLEFAAGIPGTVGGALLMNAGAYGGEMKDVVVRVEVMLPDGEIQTWEKDALELSYRHSRMMDTGAIILSVTLKLQKGSGAAIRERMQQLREQRIEKQPLEYPSAGSTFKRPKGYFAGKLIMDAGLRGYAIGDAAVSEKHCGFVINKGSATAAQVRTLMQDVSGQVEKQFGVTLEPEVVFLGEF